MVRIIGKRKRRGKKNKRITGRREKRESGVIDREPKRTESLEFTEQSPRTEPERTLYPETKRRRTLLSETVQ